MRRFLRGQGAAFMVLLLAAQTGFAWGHEGHVVIALIAEHYMSPAPLKASHELLGGENIDSVTSWADEYRREGPKRDGGTTSTSRSQTRPLT
jgi:hypothetical protein